MNIMDHCTENGSKTIAPYGKFVPIRNDRNASADLDQYLVGFWVCAEISGLLKKNRLEKLVSRVKRSAYLHASTKQNFLWRRFSEVNRISIIFL